VHPRGREARHDRCVQPTLFVFQVEHPRLVLLRASLLRLAPVRDPGTDRAHGRSTHVGGPKRAFRRVPSVRGVLLRARTSSTCPDGDPSPPGSDTLSRAVPVRSRLVPPRPPVRGPASRARDASADRGPSHRGPSRSRAWPPAPALGALRFGLAARRYPSSPRVVVTATRLRRQTPLVDLCSFSHDPWTQPRARVHGAEPSARTMQRARKRAGRAARNEDRRRRRCPHLEPTHVPPSPLRLPRGREAPRLIRLGLASV
jgi:hypothetical protein